MAIARIFDGKGWSAEQYDTLIAELAQRLDLADGTSAPGVLYHWAATTDVGVRAVDVYESREAADRLAVQHIAPIAESLGLTPPEIAEFEVHNILTP